MFVLLFVIACTLLIGYIKWKFSYWERKGFPYFKAQLPFGVLNPILQRKKSSGMTIYDIYKNSDEKMLGIYLFLRPALLVRDAELVRDILTKDFISFHDRGIYVDEEVDPLSSNLFSSKGKSWKNMRTKLAPTFTSGKLKAMFGTVEDVSNKMVDHLNSIVPDEGTVEIEIKYILATYAIDIIGSVIFGLDVNSYKNPNNDFRALTKNVNAPTTMSVLRLTAQFLYPSVEKIFVALGWKDIAPYKLNDIVKRTIEYRDKHNVIRKDMLQLLLQLRNTGNINADDDVWAANKGTDLMSHMSIETISAQLYIFYIAGFETSASSAAFTIYELSQYPDLLAKAQEDVEQALKKHDGQLTYESIKDMKFLDLCVMESVRKYPALPFLNRECTEDYLIPGTDKMIPKGMPILISLFGMHRDEKYFADALGYHPERFLESNMNYDPVAYIPFGDGPRHCVAQRMGKVNVKVAVAQILRNFNIEARKERTEIEFDTYGIPIFPKGGVNVRLSKKQQTNNHP